MRGFRVGGAKFRLGDCVLLLHQTDAGLNGVWWVAKGKWTRFDPTIPRLPSRVDDAEEWMP